MYSHYLWALRHHPLRRWLGIFVVVEESQGHEAIGMLRISCSRKQILLLLKAVLVVILSVPVLLAISLQHGLLAWPWRILRSMLWFRWILWWYLVFSGLWFMFLLVNNRVPWIFLMVPLCMNHHNMLLIAELLTIMRVHFVLGQEWLGFYILVIMFSLFLPVTTPLTLLELLTSKG